MAKNNTDSLLDLKTVTQPFDLKTALQYMKEHGEFIRCKTSEQDFYMYLDVQKRPSLINGKRQFIEVETVWAFNQWGGTTTNLAVSDFFRNCFYIMTFDELGHPDWSDPSINNL